MRQQQSWKWTCGILTARPAPCPLDYKPPPRFLPTYRETMKWLCWGRWAGLEVFSHNRLFPPVFYKTGFSVPLGNQRQVIYLVGSRHPLFLWRFFRAEIMSSLCHTTSEMGPWFWLQPTVTVIIFIWAAEAKISTPCCTGRTGGENLSPRQIESSLIG